MQILVRLTMIVIDSGGTEEVSVPIPFTKFPIYY